MVLKQQKGQKNNFLRCISVVRRGHLQAFLIPLARHCLDQKKKKTVIKVRDSGFLFLWRQFGQAGHFANVCRRISLRGEKE
ncbi:hypothetical protein CEXT_695491 [Caerostris extrusa]|uniref:Uncharacterized protein n=1 Tax=Caerostris extrusa TaxID=172846 RepID=A0AAV4VR82_CAEEX|nr:hypothetical protein CEXT_695491 [Caerostris extrusa]